MISPAKIRVLIVEDSPVAQILLSHLIEADPKLEVAGVAASGEEAIQFLEKQAVDVVLMDIHLHGIDGYETTRRLMETHPVPIVICSGAVDVTEAAATFRALEAGAVSVVAKPAGTGHPDSAVTAAKLLETLRLMAGIKVIRRWPRLRGQRPPARQAAATRTGETFFPVVVIGTSTGGPPVLQTILRALPRDFPVPVLIVQHIAPGFLPGMVDWLAQTTGFAVGIAAAGEIVQPGRAYLAPDGCHLGLSPEGRVVLSTEPPESGLRPSVAHLFRSAAAAGGAHAAAVLLTGMGRDGATELRALKDVGALTIVQDAASTLVNGMPGAALELDAATKVLAPPDIAGALVRWATVAAARRTGNGSL